MPDPPLDFLFIIGLLIASFVGKLLESRTKNKKRGTNDGKKPFAEPGKERSEDKNLGDLLKEAFGEVVEPIPEETSSRKYMESEHVPTNQIPQKLSYSTAPSEKQEPTKEASFFNQHDDQTKKTKTAREWLKNDALISQSSLRRAFLVKEVLDQPLGLKRFKF